MKHRRNIDNSPVKNKHINPSMRVAIGQIMGSLADAYKSSRRNYEAFKGWWEELKKDPKKFKQGEREAHRPKPKGWTEKEWERFLDGYYHGRTIESGNFSQLFRHAAREMRAICDQQYGPRPGLPTPKQVSSHKELHMVGMWILVLRLDEMPYRSCTVMAIATDANGALCEQRGKKLRPITFKEQERIIFSHPVDISGTPVPWPEDR